MSHVNTLVTALVAALNTPTPVTASINRVRLRPLAKETALAVVVRPLQSDVAEASLSPGYPVSWTTAVAVDCYARSGTSTAPDAAVDALVDAVYARLMADTTLGSAVVALQPGSIGYDFDADGEQTTCATLVFNARHRTAGSTLT